MIAEVTELSALEKALVLKLRALPEEKAAEVQDFIEFLSERLEEDQLTDAAMKLSEEVLREVWDDESDYDDL
jgi:hypothetical protein